jgi:alpha-beta hydrolase superfamily lysophospholipase
VDTRNDQFRLSNGDSAYLQRWLPPGHPVASIQVIHGMAEHGARYARLAGTLTDAGYAVYAQDLPGHGRSVRSPDELGHFPDGWHGTLRQINEVRGLIEREQQDTPLFMLGHSMGSFLLQHYVVEHGVGLAGAIFSATSGDLGPLRAVGLALMRMEALWYGRRHPSAIADLLTFRDFNRKFRPNRTEFDWLSRDDAEVDRYIADPRCGFRCSSGLWAELLNACGQLDDPQRLRAIPQSMPVLIVGGSADAATAGDRGPRALEQHYRKARLQDVAVRIYADARHELLNETCREQVTGDLLDWLKQHSR